METRRLILFGMLAFVIMSLWQRWQHDYPNADTSATLSQQQLNTQNNLLPQEPLESGKAVPVQHIVSSSRTEKPTLVHVKTDVLDIDIDLLRGDVVQASLLQYPVSIDEKNKPFTLLSSTPNARYVAKSNVLTKNNTGLIEIPLHYTSKQQQYTLAEHNNMLDVILQARDSDGLAVKKTFTFKRGSYLIETQFDLDNQSNSDWKGYITMQILQSSPQEDKSSLFHIGTYTGASYGNPPKSNYNKVSFSDITKTNLNQPVNGGWIAMQQHYFLSAWIPDSKEKNVFYTRHAEDDYLIGYVSQPIVLLPKQTQSSKAALYLGPEDTNSLQLIAPGLDLTVDYGILWFLSSFLFSLMTWIYQVVGNWGWSIVLVTILIKLIFYRLSAKSYRSMASMKKLQPKLLALRERLGDDKAKLSQATMALYREEKVNPLGGCLPILVQIPVFIALYWVLLESVALRQAPFILWIHDLTSADPYHVLPVIMGLTMLIQQRLNPAPPDPMQAKMMMFLPILFTALFWSFPAGLVLYWTVNNGLSILQQWYITRQYGDNAPLQVELKDKKTKK